MSVAHSLQAAFLSQPRFPQELFDLFIDALGEPPLVLSGSQRAALRSCNLVCRSFSNRARRHLFYRVEAMDNCEINLSKLTTLYELMTWIPSKLQEGRLVMAGIAPYMKEFCCRYGPYDDDEALFHSVGSILSAIFQALHGSAFGVHAFELLLPAAWSELWPGFRHSLCDLLHSPHLRSFSLQGVDDIPTTLLVGTRITRLKLFHCSHEVKPMSVQHSMRYANLESEHSFSYPLLESLDTDHISILDLLGETVAQASSRPALSQLRILSSAICYHEDFKTVQKLLSRTVSSLERLDLRYYPIEGSASFVPDASFDLSQLKKLRHFCFYHTGELTEPEGPEGPEVALEDFGIFCSLVNFPISLETLELVILMTRREDNTQHFLQSFQQDQMNKWSTFDSVLASSTFSTVRNVILSLHFNFWIADLIDGGKGQFVKHAHSLLRDALPLLSSSKTGKKLSINIAFSKDPGNWKMRNLDDVVNPGED